MKHCDVCRSPIAASDSSYRVGLDKVRACKSGDCLNTALKQQKEQRYKEAQTQRDNEQDNEQKEHHT